MIPLCHVPNKADPGHEIVPIGKRIEQNHVSERDQPENQFGNTPKKAATLVKNGSKSSKIDKTYLVTFATVQFVPARTTRASCSGKMPPLEMWPIDGRAVPGWNMLNRLVLSTEQADAVMRLFWRFGYNGAPLDQVATALDLSLEQVFAQVGGRSGVFLALLHHFRNRLGNDQHDFVHHGHGLQPLERLFVGLIAAQGNADLPSGYLIIATASEIGSNDLVLSAAVQSYFDQIRDMLAGVVRNAAAHGELIADVDCEAAGDFLFGSLLALRMMHRINAAPQLLRNYVSGVMHYLQRLKGKTPDAILAEQHSPA